MRRAAAALTASLAVLGVRAAAQTSIADGVVAFAHADYQRAADILQPITEKSLRPADPVASFFMGMLYEAGLGVPRELSYACAHYMNAAVSMGTANDLVSRAATPFAAVLSNSSPEMNQDCERLIIQGFDTHFRPQAFQMDSGQMVDWDERGATVWYQGTSKRFQNQFQARHGGVFLPLQYTGLETGRQRADRRHFIEVALWQRVPPPPASWNLEWHLFEVVRGDLLNVATETVATFAGNEPPDSSSAEALRNYVTLGVNEDGDATWSLTSDRKPSSHVIDIESDREVDHADKAMRQARDAARASAWKHANDAPRDANREPSFTYVAADTDGCGLVQLAGWSSDRSEAIVVRTLDRAPLHGNFDLATAESAIRVDVHVYNGSISDRFCTDATTADPGEEDRTWHARSGTVTIDVAPPASPNRKQRAAKITINDAVFVSPSGQTVTLSRPVVLTTIVDGFVPF